MWLDLSICIGEHRLLSCAVNLTILRTNKNKHKTFKPLHYTGGPALSPRVAHHLCPLSVLRHTPALSHAKMGVLPSAELSKTIYLSFLGPSRRKQQRITRPSCFLAPSIHSARLSRNAGVTKDWVTPGGEGGNGAFIVLKNATWKWVYLSALLR